MADDDYSIPKYFPEGLSHDSAEEDPFENARQAGKVPIIVCIWFHTSWLNLIKRSFD